MIGRVALGTILTAVTMGTVCAQTMRSVGPGGFADIPTAIAASSPGDIVVIARGTYGGFVLDRGLTLIGANYPDRAQVRFGDVVIAVPSGQEARIVNIDFAPLFGTQLTSGVVELQSCSFVADQGAGLEIHDATVTATECAFRGLAGAFVVNASFSAVQSTLVGIPRGYGLAVAGGSAQLAGCTIQGGAEQTSLPVGPPRPGIAVGFGGSVSVTRSSVSGGNSFTGFPPASAAEIASGCALRHFATTFQAGHSSSFPSPAAIVGVDTPTELLAATHRPPATGSGFPSGTVTTIDVDGVPGHFAVLLATLALHAPTASPLLADPHWGLDLGAVALGFGLLDASGQVSFSVTLPGGPLSPGAGIWFHAVGGASLPLLVAPPVGGVLL